MEEERGASSSRAPSPSPAHSAASDLEKYSEEAAPEGKKAKGGDKDGGQWGFSGWSRDDKIPNCPTCQGQFTLTFRRHHCKECGALVCDNCSKNWMLLPRNPRWGKVRVCNACAAAIQQGQATHVEEDLVENAQIIKEIQRALKNMHETCDAHKVVLLTLDAEATGDRAPLEEYAADPESPKYSFDALRERVRQRWAEMLRAREQQGERWAALDDRCHQAHVRLGEESARVKELLARKGDLDSQLAVMDRARAERDALVRKEGELLRAVEAARRQVDELQRERAMRQERQAQRPSWVRAATSRSRAGSAEGPTAFTISTGRQDPLLAPRGGEGRLEGCRRSCALM